MNHTILIAGAGFSAEAGIPTTKELPQHFLDLGETASTPRRLQQTISSHLRRYWQTVFSYADGGDKPSFEDHFTVLDLAANTGHHLGRNFSPKQLRAIRRLSIHRVFDILDETFRRTHDVTQFLTRLGQGEGNAVLTTNWDISIERHLYGYVGIPNYSLPMVDQHGEEHLSTQIPLLKLHGSANWAYCDCCGRLISYSLTEGKGALHHGIFIDDDDLRNLDPRYQPQDGGGLTAATCHSCGARLSSRVSTFSYVKVLDFGPFVELWGSALRNLRAATTWIFVGYSLPEADFQLRHMLKAAQLGRGGAPPLRIVAVVGNDRLASQRFRRFFGSMVEVHEDSFAAWNRRQLAAAAPNRR